MKHILIILTLVIATLAGCKSKNENGNLDTDLVKNPNSANPTDPEHAARLEFEKNEHDFGTIKEGEKIAYSFKFKNSGKVDLLISNARGSCGCTVPQYPKMPIKPGDSGVIDVTFDSQGKTGHQAKQITIVANTIPSTTILTITGEVIPSETK
jgi:hypothetical protein